MQKLLWLSFFSFAASSCVTVPNVTGCTVAGKLAAGMICAETQTGVTSELTLDQTVLFLEPSQNPQRAGAICMSADDYAKEKQALEDACRQLGNNCSREAKQALSAH
jgi:hypothetical protein